MLNANVCQKESALTTFHLGGGGLGGGGGGAEQGFLTPMTRVVIVLGLRFKPELVAKVISIPSLLHVRVLWLSRSRIIKEIVS